MKIEQYKKIGMSVALATVLSLSVTGCGGSSDSESGTDVTVERGKVYDATVTDSSTPVQTATQKSGKNVYTFSKAPTFPVIVTGGWIDVNDDGKQGTEDVALDIQMKSYTTTVTPITTYVADADKTIREQKLEALAAKLNESGIGEDATITVEDLLKVPSAAPADVMITANAIYKDFKEKGNTTGTNDTEILSQFSTIEGYVAAGADAKTFEEAVMQNLVNQNLINTYTQAYIDSLKPVVETPSTGGGDTTTGGGDTTTGSGNTGGTALPDLSSYSSIVIYKNISQTVADTLLSEYSANNGFQSSKTTASCTDFGFTANDLRSQASTMGFTTKLYSINNTTSYVSKTCTEADYSGAQYASGNVNILAYYGN